MDTWTVGELADATGVTVRTLHHYDDVGLLTPAHRDPNGYRRYDTDDLRRLRRILFYRALELPLDQIAVLLDDDTADERSHLERQSALLEERIGELEHVRKAITRALEEIDMGTTNLTTDEIREVFGDEFADHADEYATEARDRWGNTDAWQQSRQRTKDMTKEQWMEVKAEMDEIHERLAALLRAGVPAEDESAMDAAEAHRRHIDTRFYDCSHELHTNLGEMYVADERFTRTYEDIEEGLAAYVRDAIVANGVRHA